MTSRILLSDCGNSLNNSHNNAWDAYKEAQQSNTKRGFIDLDLKIKGIVNKIVTNVYFSIMLATLFI